MITYLATKMHTYTIGSYLETWGQSLAGRFRVVTYNSSRPPFLGVGPYVDAAFRAR